MQQIANSAALEPLREQSNVGQRAFSFIFERLISQNLLGQLEEVPGLAESWKRIDERTVDVHIANLRRKIEADPAHPRYLVTVQGIGYKFVVEE